LQWRFRRISEALASYSG